MKRDAPGILLFVAVLLSAGCVNPQFPKDAHIEKASIRVTTPWGGYEMQIEQLDTGAAARNSTLRPAVLPPVIKAGIRSEP